MALLIEGRAGFSTRRVRALAGTAWRGFLFLLCCWVFDFRQAILHHPSSALRATCICTGAGSLLAPSDNRTLPGHAFPVWGARRRIPRHCCFQMISKIDYLRMGLGATCALPLTRRRVRWGGRAPNKDGMICMRVRDRNAANQVLFHRLRKWCFFLTLRLSTCPSCRLSQVVSLARAWWWWNSYRHGPPIHPTSCCHPAAGTASTVGGQKV
ncbi:hypothetical protein BDY17DRAFT_198426 [Neohortaea acidophila]|uniref:Uncharacterized protein n=1 Tax=Neohortaea acidophila TaxID=245834 RepID=A0A6A6PKX2_9PEZI|nr:uncharacterized protein BDY17DRAFT_198426 [Neohortaea acidophila]KAF2480710.1 hypothetical protein BDY17DRAFT_198426 [Neohortaea acidophila]